MRRKNDDDLPMDREVYERGTTILKGLGGEANAVEAWVRRVAKESGQRVDWFYCYGRVFVKAMGDVERARAVAERLMPEFPLD